MKEELDVDHSPAINPLPFDPLGPIMVTAELHDDFWGTDENQWGQEEVNSEEKYCEQSDEEDDIDDTGSGEEDPVLNANEWESCQPPSIKDARTCLTTKRWRL